MSMSYEQRDKTERELGLHYDQGDLIIRDLEHAEAVVSFIEKIADDDEGAHWSQDQLWSGTLRAIANGAENPAELAAKALEADKIKFSRWYA